MKLSDLILALESPEKFAYIDSSTARDLTLTFINEAGSFSSDSAFFLGGFEFGPSYLIHVEAYRGDGFEAAYEAWIDALPTIPDEELVEAYAPNDDSESFLDLARDAAGPLPRWGTPEYDAWSAAYRAKAVEMLNAAVEAARNEDGDWPTIVEGYRENSSGGVVNIGHYECFQEADLGQIEVRRLCDAHDDCKSCPELALACASK